MTTQHKTETEVPLYAKILTKEQELFDIIEQRVEDKSIFGISSWMYNTGFTEGQEYEQQRISIEGTPQGINPTETNTIVSNDETQKDDIMLKTSLSALVTVGTIEKLTLHELAFLEFAISLPNLLEIVIVDDLGFNDFWLVFPSATFDDSMRIMKNCDEGFFNYHKGNCTMFNILTPTNINEDYVMPVARLKPGGRGDASTQ